MAKTHKSITSYIEKNKYIANLNLDKMKQEPNWLKNIMYTFAKDINRIGTLADANSDLGGLVAKLKKNPDEVASYFANEKDDYTYQLSYSLEVAQISSTGPQQNVIKFSVNKTNLETNEQTQNLNGMIWELEDNKTTAQSLLSFCRDAREILVDFEPNEFWNRLALLFVSHKVVDEQMKNFRFPPIMFLEGFEERILNLIKENNIEILIDDEQRQYIKPETFIKKEFLAQEIKAMYVSTILTNKAKESLLYVNLSASLNLRKIELSEQEKIDTEMQRRKEEASYKKAKFEQKAQEDIQKYKINHEASEVSTEEADHMKLVTNDIVEHDVNLEQLSDNYEKNTKEQEELEQAQAQRKAERVNQFKKGFAQTNKVIEDINNTPIEELQKGNINPTNHEEKAFGDDSDD